MLFRSHIGAVFDDIKIYNESIEHLRKFYTTEESQNLLKIVKGKTLPNYAVLEEKKYILKNIEKKEKVLNKIKEDKNVKTKKVVTQRLLLKELADEIKKQTRINSIRNNTKSNITDLINKFVEQDNSLLLQSNCNNVKVPFTISKYKERDNGLEKLFLDKDIKLSPIIPKKKTRCISQEIGRASCRERVYVLE